MNEEGIARTSTVAIQKMAVECPEGKDASRRGFVPIITPSREFPSDP